MSETFNHERMEDLGRDQDQDQSRDQIREMTPEEAKTLKMMVHKVFVSTFGKNWFSPDEREIWKIWEIIAPRLLCLKDTYTDSEESILAAIHQAREDGEDFPETLIEQKKRQEQREQDRRTRISETRTGSQITTNIFRNELLAVYDKGKLGPGYLSTDIMNALNPANLKSENSEEIERCAEEIVTSTGIHQQLMQLLLGFAYTICKTYPDVTTDTRLEIPLGPFFSKLGIDYRPQREWDPKEKKYRSRTEYPNEDPTKLKRERFKELILPYFAFMPELDGESYQVVNFAGYDKDKAYIRMPYMIKVAKIIIGDELPVHRRALGDFKSNWSVYQLMSRIEYTICTRGCNPKPDGRSYAKVKFSTLIDDCPNVKLELKHITDAIGPLEQDARDQMATAKEIETARKMDHKSDRRKINKKLKALFDQAIQMIASGKLPLDYPDLEIKCQHGNAITDYKAPTKTTLDDVLIISHTKQKPESKTFTNPPPTFSDTLGAEGYWTNNEDVLYNIP